MGVPAEEKGSPVTLRRRRVKGVNGAGRVTGLGASGWHRCAVTPFICNSSPLAGCCLQLPSWRQEENPPV